MCESPQKSSVRMMISFIVKLEVSSIALTPYTVYRNTGLWTGKKHADIIGQGVVTSKCVELLSSLFVPIPTLEEFTTKMYLAKKKKQK